MPKTLTHGTFNYQLHITQQQVSQVLSLRRIILGYALFCTLQESDHLVHYAQGYHIHMLTCAQIQARFSLLIFKIIRESEYSFQPRGWEKKALLCHNHYELFQACTERPRSPALMLPSLRLTQQDSLAESSSSKIRHLTSEKKAIGH